MCSNFSFFISFHFLNGKVVKYLIWRTFLIVRGSFLSCSNNKIDCYLKLYKIHCQIKSNFKLQNTFVLKTIKASISNTNEYIKSVINTILKICNPHNFNSPIHITCIVTALSMMLGMMLNHTMTD